LNKLESWVHPIELIIQRERERGRENQSAKNFTKNWNKRGNSVRVFEQALHLISVVVADAAILTEGDSRL